MFEHSIRLFKGCFDENIDYESGSIATQTVMKAKTAQECQILCQKLPECFLWTWAKPEHQTPLACYLKNEIERKMFNSATISGPKMCDGIVILLLHRY